MKPFELYQVLSAFNQMASDETLTVAQKIVMGKEWLSSLPPQQLCVTSKSSHQIVSEMIKGRLLDMESTIGRERTGESTGGTGLGRSTSAPSKKATKGKAGVESKPQS